MKKLAILFLLIFVSPAFGADILLVDDDLGIYYANVESYYTDALDELGMEYDVHEVMDVLDNGPDYQTMSQYNVVIWFCGESYGYDPGETLSDTDEANLGQYLDNGGNLFLIAQDYLYDQYYGDDGTYYDFTDSDFPYAYMGLISVTHDEWVVSSTDSLPAYGHDNSIVSDMSFKLTSEPFDETGGELYIDLLDHAATNFLMVGDETRDLAPSIQRDTGVYKLVFTTVEFGALQDIGNGTPAELMGSVLNFFGVTGVVDENITDVPPKVALHQNFPNPFNPETSIRFQVPQKTDVKVGIYDVTGNLVKVLADEPFEAGYHNLIWKGVDEANNSVPSGLYIYRMETGDEVQTKNCLLLK